METVLDCTVPLYGRMIHGHYRSGKLWESSQAYDVLGRVSLFRSGAFKPALREFSQLLSSVLVYILHRPPASEPGSEQ